MFRSNRAKPTKFTTKVLQKKKDRVESIIFHSAQIDVKQISPQVSVSEQRLLCNCVNVTDKEFDIIIL